MILRIPDYYEEFKCSADWCKDSCCIGWEINIDEDTHDYYKNADGEIGTRLRENMYENEEGEWSFRLAKNRRCPFLNASNLCDICIHMGEEALSEVCTEYPRFSLGYADVIQKCLSLSCEEAGRLLFSKEEPVRFLEIELVGECEEDDFELKMFLEHVMAELFKILQDRNRGLKERMNRYLSYLSFIQKLINEEDYLNSRFYGQEELGDTIPLLKFTLLEPSYNRHKIRMQILGELEVLDKEWQNVYDKMKDRWSESTYNDSLLAFYESGAYKEMDYENLMVYFTFRYFMNAYYNLDVLSYGRLAVVFTRMVCDMDMLFYEENGGAFSRADRVDTARIFSKEVEHSEENVEYIREELMFL